jgi:hypothetical protein
MPLSLRHPTNVSAANVTNFRLIVVCTCNVSASATIACPPHCHIISLVLPGRHWIGGKKGGALLNAH